MYFHHGPAIGFCLSSQKADGQEKGREGLQRGHCMSLFVYIYVHIYVYIKLDIIVLTSLPPFIIYFLIILFPVLGMLCPFVLHGLIKNKQKSKNKFKEKKGLKFKFSVKLKRNKYSWSCLWKSALYLAWADCFTLLISSVGWCEELITVIAQWLVFKPLLCTHVGSIFEWFWNAQEWSIKSEETNETKKPLGWPEETLIWGKMSRHLK